MIKKLLHAIAAVLYALMVIWEVLEFLLLPALFVLLGLWKSLPWQYYAITVGGYFGIFLVMELVLTLIFRLLDKKYVPLIVRKLKKHFGETEEDS